MLTLSEAREMVSNKHHYYDAVIRFGYMLPKESSTIITMAYLQKVRKG